MLAPELTEFVFLVALRELLMASDCGLLHTGHTHPPFFKSLPRSPCPLLEHKGLLLARYVLGLAQR